MHDVVIVGIPLLAILAGIRLNRSDAAAIRAELRDGIKGVREDALTRHAELLTHFNVLDFDMRQFYHLTGKLEARMDSIEKQ